MTPRASLCPAISRSSARCSRWSSPSFTPRPSLVVPHLRFYGPVRVMPSLGTGELPYPLLEAAIFPGGRGVAPHDLRGQPEALALQALYLPAHLLFPHAALHRVRSQTATPAAAALFRGLSASAGVVAKSASLPFTAFTTFLQASIPSRGGSTRYHPV